VSSNPVAGATKTRDDDADRDEPHTIARDLHDIVADFWRYRELLYQLTLRDVKIRYKQAIMGFGWAVLMPVLIVGAGVVVRYAMGSLSGASVAMTELAGIAVKAIPWAFFVGAIGFATPSLTSNTTLVTKVYFAREVFPLSAVFAQAFDSSIGAMALIVALPFMGVQITTAWLWAPLLAVILLVFTAGLCLFLSCANLFFRDVKYIVHVLVMFGIFATPVFFEPEMFGPRGAELIMLNPLSPLLEGFRLAVVEGHNLAAVLTTETQRGTVTMWTPLYLAYSTVWAVAGLFLSSIMFHRLEYVFAEKV
jgi:lipopolysaccharide transport system permease protein